MRTENDEDPKEEERAPGRTHQSGLETRRDFAEFAYWRRVRNLDMDDVLS